MKNSWERGLFLGVCVLGYVCAFVFMGVCEGLFAHGSVCLYTHVSR